MLDDGSAIAVIAVMMLVTFGLRALPFVATRWLNKHPAVRRLGQFLPLAIMTLLLTHSAVGAATQDPAGPWPECLAVFLVLAIQWWKRNPLLSVLVGTAVYVVVRNMGHF
jgi:branched-subunit amino acid transport protein AzlD